MIDNLIKLLCDGIAEIPDPRKGNFTYSLSNLLNLGFSMFHLKDPSLSSFRDQYDVRAENLERVYGVTDLPGDTALRKGIDQVEPSELQGLFKPSLDFLKSKGGFTNHRVLGKYIAVSVDGTEHYCSGSKSCSGCFRANASKLESDDFSKIADIHRSSKSSFFEAQIIVQARNSM